MPVVGAAVLVLVCLQFLLLSCGLAIQLHSSTAQAPSELTDSHSKAALNEKLIPDGTLLLVPRLKLAFCFIPKNACSEFNRLMNFLNGDSSHLGAICTSQDPNFASSWKYFHGANPDAIMADPSWTKAVFLRDPLERLVSAYRDKCEPPMPCRGKGCFATSFEEAVEKLHRPEESENGHYAPQDQVCGGLSRRIHNYDYVGHLSYNFSHVHKQVEEMIHLAMRRSARKSNRSADRFSMGMGLATETLDEFVQGAIQHSFGIRSEKDKCEPHYSSNPSEICRYFPPKGPNRALAHNHVSTDEMFASYYTPATLRAAQRFYKVDYKTLPGLRHPEWTKNVQ